MLSKSKGETRNISKNIWASQDGNIKKTLKTKKKNDRWKANKNPLEKKNPLEVKRRNENNREKIMGENEIRSTKYDLSTQCQDLRDVYGPQYIFSCLFWFPCLKKTKDFRIHIVHSNL